MCYGNVNQFNMQDKEKMAQQLQQLKQEKQTLIQ